MWSARARFLRTLDRPEFAASARPQERREPPSTGANSKASRRPARNRPSSAQPTERSARPSSWLPIRPTPGAWSGRRSVVQFPAEQRPWPSSTPHSNAPTATSASSSSTTSAPRGGSSANCCARSDLPRRTRPSTGQAALDMLLNARYDCVIADVDMPRLDGFDLVAAMRRHPSPAGDPGAPGHARPEQGRGECCASQVRANGYVVHPLTRSGPGGPCPVHSSPARLDECSAARRLRLCPGREAVIPLT